MWWWAQSNDCILMMYKINLFNKIYFTLTNEISKFNFLYWRINATAGLGAYSENLSTVYPIWHLFVHFLGEGIAILSCGQTIQNIVTSFVATLQLHRFPIGSKGPSPLVLGETVFLIKQHSKSLLTGVMTRHFELNKHLGTNGRRSDPSCTTAQRLHHWGINMLEATLSSIVVKLHRKEHPDFHQSEIFGRTSSM